MILEKINEPKDIKKLSIKELEILCEELRDYIVEVVSRTGGHLASNLGVVELTVAIHYVFDTPEDKIVWDVGHQSYVHKILTGRKDKFPTLRQYGGLSGFPKRSESDHDAFDAGHSGTSISAALGLAAARDLKGAKNKVIAVTGDASLSNGLSLEAINNAGHLKKDLIVILNDNEMSISPNVGAISNYLDKITTGDFYKNTRQKARELFSKSSLLGVPVLRIAKVIEEGIKGLISQGIMFEELGFKYVGPEDGHNIEKLINTLKSVRKFNEPILFHVITKKGKGYKHAEKNPTAFHGTPAFEIESGETNGARIKTFTQAFGDSLLRLAGKDKKITAITAAMSSGTGLEKFRLKYPDRFFDVGIAEEHAVTFAAGLAAGGYKPVVAIYSTFLQRSYDQISHDVAMQNLPVIFAVDRAGIVGDDGETHQGVFDISYLRHIPNLTIMAPADEFEFEKMLVCASKLNSPSVIRYPRGEISEKKLSNGTVVTGRSSVLRTGGSVCVIAVGSRLPDAIEAVKAFEAKGGKAGLVNARFIKPLDTALLKKLAAKYKKIIIVEENIIAGGYGSAVLEFFNGQDIKTNVKLIGLPDKFIEHGARKLLLNKYGLTKDGILKAMETK